MDLVEVHGGDTFLLAFLRAEMSKCKWLVKILDHVTCALLLHFQVAQRNTYSASCYMKMV